MSNLHTLPEPPLPAGWEVSPLFAEEWVRPVLKNWPTREGEDQFVAVLRVVRAGEWFTVFEDEAVCATLREACAAAERAYCGCYVGQPCG